MEGRIWIAFVAVIVHSALGDAKAASLSKEACDVIESERAGLAAAGIEDAIQKGPAWAKANLTSAKLKDVERYIGLREQLLFKCGQAKLRTLPVQEPEDAVDGLPQASPPEVEPAAERPKPAPKKVAKPKVDPVATQAAPAPRLPAKAKPKADDAYRPPQKADAKAE